MLRTFDIPSRGEVEERPLQIDDLISIAVPAEKAPAFLYRK